jgi:hypothetical protein
VLAFSEQAHVHHWFLRCAVCGHVWTIDKKLRRTLDQRSHSTTKVNAA